MDGNAIGGHHDLVSQAVKHLWSLYMDLSTMGGRHIFWTVPSIKLNTNDEQHWRQRLDYIPQAWFSETIGIPIKNIGPEIQQGTNHGSG
jgi:hypothetical protein